MKFLRLLLLLLVPLGSRAQADTASVQPLAEDFVTASVCVASPGEQIYSALGHVCLRLQCPAHELDYVYSYESEDAAQKVLQFFAGQLKMAVRAVPTKQYVEQYIPEGRGVKEYELNLPIRVKQRLWQQMDQRLQFSPVPYDYLNRGCAVSLLQWLEEAIGSDSIDYAPWPEKYGRSRKEIGRDSVASEWVHFFLSTFAAGESERLSTDNRSKVIVPTELIEVLQGAKAFGQPLISGEGQVLLEQTHTVERDAITPFAVALIVLLLAVCNLWLRSKWLRALVLAPCLLIGLFVSYLILFSHLPATEWNWLIIPFCPLPFLLWKWRRWWTLPFASVCIVWVVGLLIYPHGLADHAHLILAVAMAVCNIEIYISTNHIKNKKT